MNAVFPNHIAMREACIMWKVLVLAQITAEHLCIVCSHIAPNAIKQINNFSDIHAVPVWHPCAEYKHLSVSFLRFPNERWGFPAGCRWQQKLPINQHVHWYCFFANRSCSTHVTSFTVSEPWWFMFFSSPDKPDIVQNIIIILTFPLMWHFLTLGDPCNYIIYYRHSWKWRVALIFGQNAEASFTKHKLLS